MNSWLFFWAPHLYLPFSGSVAQQIEPNTKWFFDSIPSSAGDAQIEKKAFEVASYGRQLGLITEVLMDIAETSPPSTADGRESLKRLKAIQAEIERLKEYDAETLVLDVEKALDRLKRRHRERYPQLRQRLQDSLSEDDA